MTLVDTNVLLDIATNDAKWLAWSLRQLDAAAIRGPVLIDAVVYAEFSIGYARIEEVNRVVADVGLTLAEAPRSAARLGQPPLGGTPGQGRFRATELSPVDSGRQPPLGFGSRRSQRWAQSTPRQGIEAVR